MAKELLVKLTDELDGSEAVEKVTFALRSQQFEVDLGPKNVAGLEKALERRQWPGPGRIRPEAKVSLMMDIRRT